MIVRFNPCSEDLQRLQVGPIGPHLRGFAALVTKQNYCNVTGWLKVRLVAKFSRWLQRHRITLKELNEARIDRFLHARWKRLARHAGDRITMDCDTCVRSTPHHRSRFQTAVTLTFSGSTTKISSLRNAVFFHPPAKCI